MLLLMAAGVLGIVVGGAFVASGLRVASSGPALVKVERDPLASEQWNLWLGWQRDTLPSTIFRLLGIGRSPSNASGEQSLRAYFGLTSKLRAAGPDSPEARTLEAERRAYENDAEAYVARLITEAAEEAGLDRALPLFNGARITWPPVNFELTAPPRILIRSPRDRIERAGDTLLKNDLSIEQVQAIERRTDDADTSSIVEPIGGLAAYPAVIAADRTYDGWLETTAHEWVHHYLAFHPLGEQWGRGGDGITLNETVANIAGRELAARIRASHPLKLPPGEDGGAPARECSAERVDFNKEMRALRLEVDALLAAGKVTEAETLMETRRQYLGEHCVFIRKINQAYFAFHGSYADTPASSDPIGPKVEAVWDRTRDVGVFMRAMREVTSVGELDALLARLGP
jgi:hypothetical protein